MEICGKLFGSGLARPDAPPGSLPGLLPMGACSACAGDYEDPDRTAWVTWEGEDEDATHESTEEFPAEK